MIIKETVTINGVNFTYTHSDAGMMIERNGIKYCEAYDPVGFNREYTETNTPISVDEETQEQE